MVTTDQHRIVQSPIKSLISTISTPVIVKLDDSNYLQIKFLFESHGIMGFGDGSRKRPSRFDNDSSTKDVEKDDYSIWEMHNHALMQLLIAHCPLLQCLA
ncbi:hypothetical protein ACFX1X_012939 [Malus domestica]